MLRKRTLKCFVALFLAIAIVFASSYTPATTKSFAATISELEEEKAKLEAERNEILVKINALKDDINKQQEYLDELQKDIDNLQGQIDTMNLTVTKYNDEIKAIENEISGTQSEIESKYELLKKRLKALYMAGEASTLEIILNCESIMDFAEKTSMIKAVTKHDTKLMKELYDSISSIVNQKNLLEKYKVDVLEDKKELETSREELAKLYEEADKVMKELNDNKGLLDHNHDELSYEIYGIEADIEAEQKAQEEAAGGAPEVDESYTGSGSFIWPCPGYTYLSSYWGDGRNHKGIDIAGYNIYGAPIVAADSGVVTWAVASGWGQGYGLSVFIDHQNGYTTRYAHMSNMIVSYGQYVTQGQIIGYVGSTGDSTGPHLHYEIRYDGVPTDPMQFYS